MPEKKSNTKKSSGAGRTRNFVAIVYPDSEHTPENWVNVLEETHVPIVISPFHDKDLTDMGEPKKPHYHVMLCFDGVKTDEQAKEIFALVGAVVSPRRDQFAVTSLRGMARYFCHLDNPDKAQYDTAHVRCLSGADYFGYIGLATDKYAAIGEMMEYCVEHQVVSYAALLMYSRSNRFDWFRVLCDNGTMVMREFLKSLEWTNKKKEVDFDAGTQTSH